MNAKSVHTLQSARKFKDGPKPPVARCPRFTFGNYLYRSLSSTADVV